MLAAWTAGQRAVRTERSTELVLAVRTVVMTAIHWADWKVHCLAVWYAAQTA